MKTLLANVAAAMGSSDLPRFYGNGINDDTAAMQALADGKSVLFGKSVIREVPPGRQIRISQTLLTRGARLDLGSGTLTLL